MKFDIKRILDSLRGAMALGILCAVIHTNALADDVGSFSSSTCGEGGNATGLLKVGQKMSINGQSNLSDCIKGKHNAVVYSSELIKGGTLGYDYKVKVSAKGPKGLGSGSFYLRFIDETNDFYDLSIWKSSKGNHETSYNSKKPNIKAMYWSNNAFPDYFFCGICKIVLDWRVIEPAIGSAGNCTELTDDLETVCKAAGRRLEDLRADFVCSVAAIEIKNECKSAENFHDFKKNLEKIVSKEFCHIIELCPIVKK